MSAFAQALIRNTYITRSGNNLIQTGIPYRFSGANIPWLGLDDSNGMVYPSQFRISDVILTAKEMGTTVIRSLSLGISVGCAMCIEPTLNQFNDQAFNSIDYAIKYARDNHLRLIIPLIDNWHYYEGGKHTFTDWRGDLNEDDFYSNPIVIQDFENYINHIINHVNTYTGTAYKNDPTILAWETGNELENATSLWTDTWTQTIAAYIKSIDTHHLVADGHPSNYSAGRNLSPTQLALSSVDMYTGHFYPPHISFMQTDANLAKQYNKVYYIGEYDWTDYNALSANGTITQDISTSIDGLYSAAITTTQVNQVNPNYLHLVQTNLTLLSGQTYTISFWAKSSTNQSIPFSLTLSQWPWTQYFSQSIALTSNWQKYTFTYSPTMTLTPMQVEFDFAQNLGTVWLDGVSVIDQNNTNIITNGSFESIGNGWLNPWAFVIQPVGDTLSSFIPAIEDVTYNIAGDLYWQLYGHDDLHGYNTGDQYTLHYPGDTQDMKNRAQILRTHAYTMNSFIPIPTLLVPNGPQINQITNSQQGKQIDWRGAIAASTYSVQKSSFGTSWQTVVSNLTDFSVPWTDTAATSGATYSYRVQSVNQNGVLGKFSNTEPGSNNYIQNGSFEHTGIYWSMPWVFAVTSPAIATFIQDSAAYTLGYYSAQVNVTNATPTSAWDVQLRQNPVPVTAGSTYTILFKAKAAAGVSDATVLMQQYTSPWTVYTKQQITLTSNWLQHSCTFTAPTTDQNAMLVYNLGKYAGQVWLDDISIINATSSATTSCL